MNALKAQIFALGCGFLFTLSAFAGGPVVYKTPEGRGMLLDYYVVPGDRYDQYGSFARIQISVGGIYSEKWVYVPPYEVYGANLFEVSTSKNASGPFQLHFEHNQISLTSPNLSNTQLIFEHPESAKTWDRARLRIASSLFVDKRIWPADVPCSEQVLQEIGVISTMQQRVSEGLQEILGHGEHYFVGINLAESWNYKGPSKVLLVASQGEVNNSHLRPGHPTYKLLAIENDKITVWGETRDVVIDKTNFIEFKIADDSSRILLNPENIASYFRGGQVGVVRGDNAFYDNKISNAVLTLLGGPPSQPETSRMYAGMSGDHSALQPFTDIIELAIREKHPLNIQHPLMEALNIKHNLPVSKTGADMCSTAL